MTATPPGPVVLWLSSRYENIELAQAALEHVCRIRSVDSEVEHWVGMALREAVANAIKHGNRQNPEKRVLVSFAGEGDDLTITVGDEGEGFDAASLADPLATENQMKTSGRGIFYIRSFMDEVSFTRGETGGTLLTMRKNIRAQKTAKGAEQR
jgi:serine/threonine-protein kinase RsbW